MDQHECNNGDKITFMNQEINYLKEQVNKLWQLVTDHDKTIAVITTKLESICTKVDDCNKAIADLTKLLNEYERRPSEITGKILVGVVIGVVTAIGTYLVMTMLKG
jgi:chromosome segregation ATPase